MEQLVRAKIRRQLGAMESSHADAQRRHNMALYANMYSGLGDRRGSSLMYGGARNPMFSYGNAKTKKCRNAFDNCRLKSGAKMEAGEKSAKKSTWVNYVKKYAKKHKIGYGEALTEALPSYNKIYKTAPKKKRAKKKKVATYKKRVAKK